MARDPRRDGGRRGPGRGRRHEGARGARPATPQKPQELDGELGLPAHLVASVRTAYGEEGLARVAEGWSATRTVTLRANALRATREEVAVALDDAHIAWDGVPWYADAFVLADGVRERSVWDLDAYEQGKLYLQSLSSMLPPLVLAPRPGADVLDMCAAPGGKTSEMCALAPGGAGERAARVTACELSHPRAERLEHNLAKLGATNVQVMRTDARTLDEWFSFDQVLLDAPCTGSGTVHTHDEHAVRTLTPELAARVERSQAALLERGLQVLKLGGELVYSTCSILPRENEDIVEGALARHPECELVPVGLAGIERVPTLPCRLDGALTVCPSRLYEGFFVAKLRKVG